MNVVVERELPYCIRMAWRIAFAQSRRPAGAMLVYMLQGAIQVRR